MRILSLTFRNLNSLTGDWHIDFTDPQFVRSGLFAITGPTGAGKSTLLDAITLALYGRTPRLERVNQSSNEIMSRHTGECFAEVAFATPAGRFRCHWAQHRARRQADGKLQSPQHEIADADSGEILDTGLNATPQRVEAVTGMNFERFTRSVLLAQGEFAAFLRADADQRAPILEQITGTEIYARISMEVHARTRSERQQRDTLQARLDEVRVLDQETRQQHTQELAQQQAQEQVLQQELTRLDEDLRWLERIATLEQALARLATEEEELSRDEAAFAPHQQRLDDAQRAQRCEAAHGRLSELRRLQHDDHQTLLECEAGLPDQQSALDEAITAERDARARLVARQEEQRAAQPLWRQVRALDLTLQAREAALQESAQALQEQRAQHQELLARQQQDQQEQNRQQQALTELQSTLAASAGDAGLLQHLTDWRTRSQRLRQSVSDCDHQSRECAEAQERLALAAQGLEEQRQALAAASRETEQQQTAFTQQQQALAEHLEQRPLAHWRGQLEELRALRNALQLLETQAREHVRNSESQTRSTALMTELGQEETRLSESLTELRTRLAAREQERRHLEETLAAQQRIADLEEARAHLHEGEPCPLCGSTHHPYVLGAPALAANANAEHSALLAHEVELRQQLEEIQGRHTETRTRRELTAQQADECAARLNASTPRLQAACRALALDWQGADTLAALPEQQQELQGQIAGLEARVRHGEALEQALAGQRETLEQARAREHACRQEWLAAGQQHELAAQKLEQLRATLTTLEERIGREQQALASELRPFLDADPGQTPLEEILATLEERQRQWQERQEHQLELARALERLQAQLRARAETLERARAEGEALAERQRHLQEECAGQRESRRQLFGERVVDTEEERAERLVQEAGNALRSASEREQEIRQAHTRLLARIGELRDALARREPHLQTARDEFLDRCREHGFADEAACLDARLAESERLALEQHARELRDARTRLDTRRQHSREELATVRAEARTTDPAETLETTRAERRDSHRLLQQKIGAVQQILDEDSRQRERRAQQIAALEAQQRECARWELLHELIGSESGKKYRNFAQGLTFEVMIAHANRQLQKMTDRYLLTRSSEQPLDLDVIDNYQAGERRTTRNLSGGESFLVSLALALGLSRMASRTVRVDSLFLDEGFGTLDADTLETALETLASLQQDGKLIGVISHVGALHERIATRIEVIPGPGGRSHLRGPGCQHEPVRSADARGRHREEVTQP